MKDKHKQSLYLPESTLNFLQDEAARQDRSLSWLVQHAVRIAADTLRRFPGDPGGPPSGGKR